MNGYTAYGLKIQSTYLLSELEPSTDTDPPDLIVRKETVSSPASESVDSDRRLTIGDDAVYLDYPSVGSFRIRDGNEILVDTVPSVDPTVLRFHLLGPAIAVALHQRGRLVLHASTVAIDGRAVAFLGESHAGKSTLAARCADAGHALLADDLGVIEYNSRGFYLHPGFPSAKLDCETAVALDRTASGPPSNGKSSVDKAYYSTTKPRAMNQYPLERIYLLADGDVINLELLAAPKAVAALYHHAYLRKLSKRTGESETLLEQCGTLAEQIPVKRLSRPRDLDQLPAVIERIEADVGE